ncbi:MAG: hypothetical protein H6867_05375 [Rhodospirillales bacterium]|nr:hypothetical protein [Rhodospirillales bacterium]MCB9994960.1 hypothetical protein [Rhodospirillales bacterium]
MISWKARNFLNICLVTAFLLSGISPACAWVGGQSRSLIEICTIDGLKTIEVSPNQQAPDQQSHEKRPDCLFCFALAKVKTTGPATAITVPAAERLTWGISAIDSTPLMNRTQTSFEARGPPKIS